MASSGSRLERQSASDRGVPAGATGRPASARASVTGRLAALGRVVLAAAVVATWACGAQSPPDDLSPEDKLEWGLERFRQGEYGSARKAFREFLVDQPLHPRSDSAQYLLGEANFQDERYVEAAEAFSRLGRNRPTSPLADDAQLGACRSYWELSPGLALDQEYTRKAVDACDRLLQYYTPSPLEEEARELRRKARDKLAAKQYRIARWYYDNRAYESANIYLEALLDSYSDAPVVPEALLTLYRSYRELGFDAEARQVRQRLLQEHGDTRQARELAGDGQPPGARSGPR